jgi:pyruvate formate lyase activating enzyme
MKEAMFYESQKDLKIRCNLCRHRCLISEGKRGICGVRENKKGILYSLVYGKSISRAIDPIEKKPLFHLYPGSFSFSLATAGCNFRCLHCQNYHISQEFKRTIPGDDLSPEKIISLAQGYECKSISYTYTEPTIFFEYAYDTARLAHDRGIKNIFVTNGYLTPEALQKISPYLDAANIDLKSFSKEFYRKICGADLVEVLDSIKLYKKLGIWIEITTLVIPNHNDSEEELRDIAEFIKNLGVETPWHISAFYPTYKLTDQPRTPASILHRARKIGLELGLRYVYEGNVFNNEGENTYCYQCGKLLISRRGYQILENNILDSRCPRCQSPIDGVGM